MGEVRVGGWVTKEGTTGCGSWKSCSCPSWTNDWPAVLTVIFQFSAHPTHINTHFISSLLKTRSSKQFLFFFSPRRPDPKLQHQVHLPNWLVRV